MKRIILVLSVFTAMFLLIVDSQTAAAGASKGLQQCIQVVIPSLFPFFFLSPIARNFISAGNIMFLRPIGKLLGIPSGTEGVLLLGFLGGYPVGAQAVVSTWEDKMLTESTAKRMLGFCNNAGPSFIFGMAGSLFTNAAVPWVLWAVQILSALILGILISKSSQEANIPKQKNVSSLKIHLPSVLKNSLYNMATVCGWIIIFRVLIEFLEKWLTASLPVMIRVGIYGVLELANGCLLLARITSDELRFILCSTLLSFGGVCVYVQTASIAGKLCTGYYFAEKLLQAFLSLIISWFSCSFLFPSEFNEFSFIPIVFLILLCSITLFKRKSGKISRNKMLSSI